MKILGIMPSLDGLVEGLSPVLYHATTMRSALRILKTNKMQSYADGISFTRSLTGAYHLNYRIMGAIFSFDGKAINGKYKGAPVGTEDVVAHFDSDNFSQPLKATLGRQNGQLEDRVASKNIDNAVSFITGAILYVPLEFFRDYQHEDELGSDYLKNFNVYRLVIYYLKKNNIKFRTVLNHKDLYNKSVDDTAKLNDVYKSLKDAHHSNS